MDVHYAVLSVITVLIPSYQPGGYVGDLSDNTKKK